MVHIADLGDSPQWFIDLIIEIKEDIRVGRDKFTTNRSLYTEDLHYSPSESVQGIAILKPNFEVVYAGRKYRQRNGDPEKEYIIYKDTLNE